MSDKEENIRERLVALREDPPDRGFSLSLHKALVEAGPPEAPGGWARVRELLRRGAPVLWPAAGVLAGIAAFLMMNAITARHEAAAPVAPQPVAEAPVALPSTTVPSSRIAVIKLDFISDVAVESADFQISLPEGLSFWADGEELPIRSFEWTQALDAGNNIIPVAVRGQKPGRYLVTATARVGDQKIEHDVVLEVTEG